MSSVIFPPKKVSTCQQVFAEVVLGRPSADCKHLGICKVKRIYSNDFYSRILSSVCNNSNKLYALATLQKDVYLELAFQRAFMDPEQLSIHFKNGRFVMEEDYRLDESFLDVPILMKSGIYNVQVSDRLLTVRFDDI